MKIKIANYMANKVGEVVTTEELHDVARPGISYQRRLRELREEGWPIESHIDNVRLRPGEYMLIDNPPTEPVRFSRRISNRLRAEVLERNGSLCQACGLGPGDRYPDNKRKVVLHIGHIKDRAHGGQDTIANLKTLCARCNEGGKHLTQEPPSWTWLLGRVKQAKIDDQRKVLEWLQKKFEV